VFAQTAGMGLNPTRIELEVNPGQEKTTAFDIESPPSDVVIRGQLLLSLTDWDVNEDGSMRYVDAGTTKDSASSWVIFSPSAVTIASGQTRLVRLTVRVPAGTAPGVYRTGIFVQERPPATPPQKGEHLVFLRFRYVFSLYVIVPPVTRHAELADLRLQDGKSGVDFACELKNGGTRHLRPLVTWSIRNKDTGKETSVDRYEAIVLLPGKTLQQLFPMGVLPPGNYELHAEVDFQDGGAIQIVDRTVALKPVQEARDHSSDVGK
jgi:P pilus assembly chaperone PapD